jgi:hypothetical protein
MQERAFKEWLQIVRDHLRKKITFVAHLMICWQMHQTKACATENSYYIETLSLSLDRARKEIMFLIVSLFPLFLSLPLSRGANFASQHFFLGGQSLILT